jgi:hypothetical protein
LGSIQLAWWKLPIRTKPRSAQYKLLLQEERLRDAMLNDHSNPPKLTAEETEEISFFDSSEGQPPGFAFYEDR